MNCDVRCNVCGRKFPYGEKPYPLKKCCQVFKNTRFIADARKALNEKQLSDCFSEIEKNDCLVGEVIIDLPLYTALKQGNRLDDGGPGWIWGAEISLYSDELLIVEEEIEL